MREKLPSPLTTRSRIWEFRAPIDTQRRILWQLLRGDWFDAARIYGQWANSESTDEALSGRRLDWKHPAPRRRVWIRSAATPHRGPSSCNSSGNPTPVAFHWYNWHQIPYDNDYLTISQPATDFSKASASFSATTSS